jgi:ATP-dependent RNA helicase SUPV3L1/SUV3
MLPTCFRARLSRPLLSTPESWLLSSSSRSPLSVTSTTKLGRRYRTDGHTRTHKKSDYIPEPDFIHGGYVRPRTLTPKPTVKPESIAAPALDQLPEALNELLIQNIDLWLKDQEVRFSLDLIGVPPQNLAPLAYHYNKAVQAKTAISANKQFWDDSRLISLWDDAASKDKIVAHRAVSRVFFAWMASPEAGAVLKAVSPPIKKEVLATYADMCRLHKVLDEPHHHERYDKARRMHRKVIMHVGPTNSGKTHHALRALAAAPTGVYAGPLRLLAHEIWFRLNAGQIVPLGVDPESLPPAEPDPKTNLDIDDTTDKPVVRVEGDPRFVRACNMVTGEEIKIVDENAGLLSCTAEMLNLNRRVAVAVIDEIQLLGDDQRGGAWTQAVLGLCADELHLCGEETAVPIVEQMLADTGDTLEIRRYQRLTPLRVADKSLNGDLTKIEKGDCVVAFSRSGIFKLKDKIEKETGLKCAVAYGALPPEIRSEQAALFNDPQSGYDVLVGSDAVGMGLNL